MARLTELNKEIKEKEAIYYNACDDHIRIDIEYLAEQNSDKQKKKRFVCSVTLKLSNKYIVERSKSRGAGHNRYTLTDPDGVVTEFNDFRNEVPEEVRNALGFSYMQQGGTKIEINYVPQLGLPLVLTYQGRDLSRLLNQINDAELFEEVQANISKHLHHRGNIAIELSTIRGRISTYETELDATVDNSDAIEHLDDTLIPALRVLAKEEMRIYVAEELLADALRVHQQEKRATEELEQIAEILSYQKILRKLSEDSERIIIAERLLSEYKIIEEKQKAAEEKLKQYSVWAQLDLSQLEREADRYSVGKALVVEYEQIGNNIEGAKAKIVAAAAAYGAAKEESQVFLRDEKICPVCRQELTEDALQHALQHFEE